MIDIKYTAYYSNNHVPPQTLINYPSGLNLLLTYA